MPGNPKFGRKIRQLREARKKEDPNFSLRKFAIAAGISATFLSKIETGEFAPPSPEKIKKMAVLLKVDADELLSLANKVDPDVEDILRSRHKVMADFLRTANNMSDEQLTRLTKKIQKDNE